MAIDLTLEYSSIGADYRTNTTMDKPTNTTDGDFLLAVIAMRVGQLTITPPSGWTSIAAKTHTESIRGKIEVFYKRASSEGSNWTWEHSYEISTGLVKRITGVVASGDPEDVGESTGETDYSLGPLTVTGITTATNSSAVMEAVSFNAANITISSSTLTSRGTVNTGGYATTCSILGDIQATAGATGNKSVSYSDYSRSFGIVFALKPAEAAASGNPWYYYAQQMRQKLEEKLKRRILIPGFADCMRYGYQR